MVLQLILKQRFIGRVISRNDAGNSPPRSCDYGSWSNFLELREKSG